MFGFDLSLSSAPHNTHTNNVSVPFSLTLIVLLSACTLSLTAFLWRRFLSEADSNIIWEPHPVFGHIETICILWFTVELVIFPRTRTKENYHRYVLRICVAPSRIHFLCGIMNIVDLVCYKLSSIRHYGLFRSQSFPSTLRWDCRCSALILHHCLISRVCSQLFACFLIHCRVGNPVLTPVPVTANPSRTAVVPES